MYVRVVVTPGAKKERVEHTGDAALAVSVREPARGNRANTRVRELVAGVYNTDIGAVRIVAGHRSPKKIINIED